MGRLPRRASGKSPTWGLPRWRHTMARRAISCSAPSSPTTAARPQPIWHAWPGPVTRRCPRLPRGATAPPLAGTRPMWAATWALTPVRPPRHPWPASLPQVACESAAPLPGRSSTGPACPASAAVPAFRPALPCGSTLRPWPSVVLALDLVNPVLRRKSARSHARGSSPSAASAAIPSGALPMISCRSSRLSLASTVPPTPAHWQNQLRRR